ncbi:hypothetical protein PQX77_008746 [Marasmius sp. AFHP31]|nr:hypothetical protein PQX77_008746 [Marasmius sp. AFHP31]
MSTTDIPFELIKLILAQLDGCKPSLRLCALVCRAWAQPTRTLLLKSILLYQTEVEPFLYLCDSPFETISLARVQEFTVSQARLIPGSGSTHASLQDCPAFNQLLKWKSSDGKGKTIVDVLSKVKMLSFNWVGWWTLDQEARSRLMTGFQSVEILKLSMVGFEGYGQIQDLISSFSTLRMLELGSIRPLLESSPRPALASFNIQHLELNSVEDIMVIEALVSCPSLRSFKCHYVNFSDFSQSQSQAIGKLLASAGSSLEEFSFTVQAAGMLNDGVVLDTRFRHLDFTRNPNLRRIELWVEDSDYLIPFLERLAMAPNNLETIDIYYLQKAHIDWARFESILLRPSFAQLRELKCVVFGLFGKKDVVGQPKGWYDGPNKGSAADLRMIEDMDDFKKKLSRLYSRGLVNLRLSWRPLATLLWTIPSRGLRISEVTNPDNPDEVTFTWTWSEGDPTQFAFGASAIDSSSTAFIPPALTVGANEMEGTVTGSIEGGLRESMVIVAYTGLDAIHDRTDVPFFTGTQTLGTTPVLTTPTGTASTTDTKAITPGISTTVSQRASHGEMWMESASTSPPSPTGTDSWGRDSRGISLAIIVAIVLAFLAFILLALVVFFCIRKRPARNGHSDGESGPLLFSPEKMISKGSFLLSRLPGRTPSYRSEGSTEGKTLLSSSDTSTIYTNDTDSYLELKRNGSAPSGDFSPLTERQMKLEMEMMTLQRRLIELEHGGRQHDLFAATGAQEIVAVRRDIEDLKSIQEGKWALELTDEVPEQVRLRFRDVV